MNRIRLLPIASTSFLFGIGSAYYSFRKSTAKPLHRNANANEIHTPTLVAFSPSFDNASTCAVGAPEATKETTPKETTPNATTPKETTQTTVEPTSQPTKANTTVQKTTNAEDQPLPSDYLRSSSKSKSGDIRAAAREIFWTEPSNVYSETVADNSLELVRLLDKDNSTVKVMLTNTSLMSRKVIGMQVATETAKNCDTSVKNLATDKTCAFIIDPAQTIELFECRQTDKNEASITIPEYRMLWKAADLLECKNRICMSINAVSPHRDAVRFQNFNYGDATVVFSFDTQNAEFLACNAETFGQVDRYSGSPAIMQPPARFVIDGRHRDANPHNTLQGRSAPFQLGVFSAIDKDRNWSYKWHYKWWNSNLSAQHDDTFLYSLPFPDDADVYVAQAPGGSYSHQGKFAIDFAMPIGTPVLAARPGVVTRMEMTNTKSKFDPGVCPLPVSLKCNTPGARANVIQVMHDDGTIAQYGHLAPNSQKVELGAYVLSRDQLASSGNTGYSKGPHLHFEVSRFTDRSSESVFVQFVHPSLQDKLITKALPDNWHDWLDVTTGKTYFYNSLSGESTAARPSRLQMTPEEISAATKEPTVHRVSSTTTTLNALNYVSDGLIYLPQRFDKFSKDGKFQPIKE